MLCEKCNSTLDYGAKYCTTCGEKISSELLTEEYSHTLWGKIQNIEDWYSKLSLQKFTGHIIVKIVVLVAILAYGVFQLYQNGTDIKILASDSYSVAYNQSADEYYIKTAEQETNLNLYIPSFTDNVRLTGYDKDGGIMNEKTLSPEDCKQEDAFLIKKNEFAYTTIQLIRNNNPADSLKIYIID